MSCLLARNETISFEQYKADYADFRRHVGDSVWPHICHFFKINLFIVVVPAHGKGTTVIEASVYNPRFKSIVLYLHDKGVGGHYEGIRRASDECGLFGDNDEIVKL